MAQPSQHWGTDRNGRRYPIYVCDSGHWHRGRVQAVKCNAKARKAAREKAITNP